MIGRFVVGLVLLAGFAGCPAAEATSPGINGSILFEAESSAAVLSLQLAHARRRPLPRPSLQGGTLRGRPTARGSCTPPETL